MKEEKNLDEGKKRAINILDKVKSPDDLRKINEIMTTDIMRMLSLEVRTLIHLLLDKGIINEKEYAKKIKEIIEDEEKFTDSVMEDKKVKEKQKLIDEMDKESREIKYIG